MKSRLLKTVSPNKTYGIVIDKSTQRLYIFKNGEYFSELAISTGLVNENQPHNETASGEFLLSSWVGGFWSDNMYAAMGIRFNGGDLIHEVPYIPLADGTKNYMPFESQLGLRASHGCVRVQRRKNADGINMAWLWENMKKNTKVLVWDDDDRKLDYPENELMLYWNPDGGQNYHLLENCHGVKEKYLPLTPFFYEELDEDPYAKLAPCTYCTPPHRKNSADQ